MDISEVDMDEIYQVSISTAMAFGLSKEQCPKNWEEFEEYYWFWMMNSDHIVVSNDCSRWCKVFFMCIFPKTVHMVYHLLPKSVRNKEYMEHIITIHFKDLQSFVVLLLLIILFILLFKDNQIKSKQWNNQSAINQIVQMEYCLDTTSNVLMKDKEDNQKDWIIQFVLL